MTRTLNKGLVPVNGQPILVTIIYQLESLGVEQIIVFGGHLSWQVEFMLARISSGLKAEVRMSTTPPEFTPAERLLSESEAWFNSSEIILIYCDHLFLEEEITEHVNANSRNRVFVQHRSPGNISIGRLNQVKYSVNREESLGYVELGYWCLDSKIFCNFLTKNKNLQESLRLFTESNFVQGSEIEKYTSVSDLTRYVNHRNKTRKTLFLDRDGILVASIGRGEYLKDVQQVEFIQNNIEQFRYLSLRYNVDFIVITNQAGIERGLVTSEEVDLINQYVAINMLSQGVPIIAFYICPHHWESNCECRKPKPGMLNRAIYEFKLNRSECFFIGDRQSDLNAGWHAGIRSLLLTEDMNTDERQRVFSELHEFFKKS